jgi:hypothetical protein
MVDNAQLTINPTVGHAEEEKKTINKRTIKLI